MVLELGTSARRRASENPPVEDVRIDAPPVSAATVDLERVVFAFAENLASAHPRRRARMLRALGQGADAAASPAAAAERLYGFLVRQARRR